MSSKTLLRSSYLLPAADESLIEDGAVVWEGETILEAGEYVSVQSRYPNTKEIDCTGQIVLPGLVNAHDHGNGVGFLQLGIKDDPLELWVPRLFSVRPLDPYLAALYDGLLLLSSGVTTTMHQHEPRDWSSLENELLDTARGYRDAGIRASVSLPLVDRNYLAYIGNEEFIDRLPSDLAARARIAGLDAVPMDMKDLISIGEQLQKHWEKDNTIWLSWGPAGPQWCTDELLQVIQAAAGGAPIQIHVLETRYQQIYGERFYGCSPIVHLNELGFLGPNVSCAHGVWLTDEDIEILASSGTMLAHCPSSNLRFRSGIARVLDLFDAGITVGIGLDGEGLNDDQDMLLEMRLAKGLAFEPGIDGRFISTRQVLRMAAQNGAQIVGGPQRGRLEPGFTADLIALRLDNICQPFLDERIDLVEATVSRAQRHSVDTVVVAGEVKIQNGNHIRQDIRSVAFRISESLSSFEGEDQREIEKLADELLPYLTEVYSDW
jgi:cytosine/adenosine deaminase-related metal-dependent hydrolase